MCAVRFSGCLAAALFAGLAWYLSPLDPGVLALQFAFSPRAFGSVVHAWPAEHLARYRAHLPVDLLLIAAYAGFGYLLATRTRLFASRAAVLRRAAPWALPLAALFDVVENGLHWWLTAAPRFGMPAVYATAAAASTMKWLLLLGFSSLAAYAMLAETER